MSASTAILHYPFGLDGSTSFVVADAGDASASDAAGDASLDAATVGGGSPGAPAQDGGGGGDATTDGAVSATDAAPDAMMTEPPHCADPAPSGPGCFACTHQGRVEGAAEADSIEIGAALQREACDFWDGYLASR